ncbi:hypothetical protein CESP606_10960 [Cereibacter sphaeroides]
MRAQPVDRALRRREQAREARGGRQARLARHRVEGQPELSQAVEGSAATLRKILGFRGPAGRSVHDDLESLGPVGELPAGAVLGADVECRILRHLSCGDRSELAPGVVGEEDVVMDERRARGAGGIGPDPGREAARVDPVLGHGVLRPVAQTPRKERRRIAVEDDVIGRKRPPVGQLHAGGAAALAQDARDRRPVAQPHALIVGQAGQRQREPVHPALDCPDPARLGRPYEREHARRTVGRAAHIGGVAPEELTQPPVAEEEPQEPVERHAGQERGPCPGRLQGPGRDGPQVGPGRAHHRPVESVIKPRREIVEAAEGAGLARAGEGRHRLDIGLEVGGEVERAAVEPPVPGQKRLGQESEVMIELLAANLEDIVENFAKREHGRACVHRSRHAREGTHPPPRRLSRLEERHLAPGPRQPDRRGQPAHPGPDHNHLRHNLSHARDC